MTEESRPPGKTPAWLWVVFVIGMGLFGYGGFVARLEHQLFGIVILAVGLAIVVTFVALRGRYTGIR
ncbi:hypothetical protein [Frondihabitans cladoniiphilus]|uniref:DUF2631 family protein n=1 Tax=Frondihabitans cladoniiphilus TaxID=715785 RepID=A0ABP8VPD0_9MICO